MRCPDCSKFVSMDLSDPEVGDVNVDGDGAVTVDIALERNCSECGQTLKTAEVTAEGDVGDLVREHEEVAAAAAKAKGQKEPEHAYEASETGTDTIEEGGGRYAKSYFGATVTFSVRCTECEEDVGEGEVSAKVAASEMDEAV